MDSGEYGVIPNPSVTLSDVVEEVVYTAGSRFRNDFELLGKHGRGGFGIVFDCQHKMDKQKYAVKRASVGKGKIPMEVIALSRLHHPRIVRYFQAWKEAYVETGLTESSEDSLEKSDDKMEVEADKEPDIIYIQMQYLPTKLEDVSLDKARAWKLYLQLVDCVVYMHQNEIMHCDLCPSNLLMDRDGNLMVIDFGLARFIHGSNQELDGIETTPLLSLANFAFRAPEIPRGRTEDEDEKLPITEKVDVYSLGVLAVSFFHDGSVERAVAELKRNRKLPDAFNEEYEFVRKVILRMTETEPENRPSASEVSAALAFKRTPCFV